MQAGAYGTSFVHHLLSKATQKAMRDLTKKNGPLWEYYERVLQQDRCIDRCRLGLFMAPSCLSGKPLLAFQGLRPGARHPDAGPSVRAYRAATLRLLRCG